ncbi:hypothetical protein BRADI_3g54553v3 [Brachypodium distachyon]|uniref:At1g61320/AtMIF1 LRR domain-containing protein n=2 Tax=Brachypodium distachyon TaxID=15368 RepID=A0A2K2D541_BRADI|nr:hypothetical protein BRADI_3g54553v3 [Brachypodium distachyon]
MILTKYELLRRVGRLVGEAKRSGRIKGGNGTGGAIVELELLTEKTNLKDAEDEPAEVMLGYGALFARFQRGCPRAFRALTRLSVENLWFEDRAAVSDLVRRCVALEHLSLRFCGFEPAAAMAIDLPPESRLRTLLCVECHVPGVDLVRAPSLVELHCGWRLVDGAPPASFGHAPELRKLTLHYQQYEDQEDLWLLSEFLVNIPRQLELLTLSFEFTKIWVQPEAPKYLRVAFGRLKELHLEKIHPSCNLSWATFLLEAAPLLETLRVKVLNHACKPDWHKKLAPSDTDHSEAAPPPSPGFAHRGLKEVAIRRAFHVAMDAPFVRTVVGMAVNLERVTLSVEELGCNACAAAEERRPKLARSRCRPAGAGAGGDDAQALVERIMGGLASSARITILRSG